MKTNTPPTVVPASGKTIYTCPMHPEVRQEHPGACPKCGMALEPKTVTAGTDGKEDAEPTNTPPTVVPASGKTIYTCPMHPGVQQEHPGACPKCGMALEPKTVTAGTDDEENADLRDITRRFWIGAALTLPVLALVMARLIPALAMQSWTDSHASRWIQFALTTPIVWWAGWPFFHRGWRRGALPVLWLAAQPDHCRSRDEPEFSLGHQQRLAPAESEAVILCET